jgi:hypothetical protein
VADEVKRRRSSRRHPAPRKDRDRATILRPESGFRFERLNNPAQRRNNLVALDAALAEFQD